MAERRPDAYLRRMAKPPAIRAHLSTIALIVAPLLALLAASLWYAARAWLSVEGPPMPATGYVAMILGVALSLLVGFALMALLFYSSRRGYDEPHRAEDDPR